MSDKPEQVKIEFHARQYAAFTSTATEILYGGAAGGGKSFYGRGGCVAWCIGIAGLQCYIIRKSYPDLIDNHTKGAGSLPTILYPLIDAGRCKYNKQHQEFNFDNGSMIKLLAAQEESEVEEIFRGKEMHVVYGDEATLLTEAQINYIKTRVRMDEATRAKAREWVASTFPHLVKGGVVPDLFPRIIWGTNPTGISHDYFKREFVDSVEPMKIWQHKTEVRGRMVNGFTRQYIPARLEDNPSIDFDSYASNLASTTRPEITKALLDGDWDVRAAGMFTDVFERSKHVIKTNGVVAPPSWWKSWSALDWGSTDPYCELWFTECSGEEPYLGYVYPRGTIIVFMEHYGIFRDDSGREIANKGVRRSPSECGVIFNEAEEIYKVDRVSWHFAGADLWNTQRVENRFYSRAGEFLDNTGRHYIRAAQGQGSRVQGWEMIRSLLKGKPDADFPGLLICSNCKHLIRTLTGLQTSIKNPDDAADKQEDHAPDALRYGLTPIWRGKELPPPEYTKKKRMEKLRRLRGGYGGYGDPMGRDREESDRLRNIWS